MTVGFRVTRRCSSSSCAFISSLYLDHIAGGHLRLLQPSAAAFQLPSNDVRMSPLLAREHCMHDCTFAGRGSRMCAPWRDTLVLLTVAVRHVDNAGRHLLLTRHHVEACCCAPAEGRNMLMSCDCRGVRDAVVWRRARERVCKNRWFHSSVPFRIVVSSTDTHVQYSIGLFSVFKPSRVPSAVRAPRPASASHVSGPAVPGPPRPSAYTP